MPRAASRAHAARLLIAGLSGFVVLTLEFAATRLFAPAFGQSSYVWSTVIGLILAALAAGYALGGRLGDRARSHRPLFLAHLCAGAFTLLVVIFGSGLSQALVPTGLPEAGGLPIAFWGSLIATLVLFVPPALLLGMTSPFLIRMDARSGSTGQAAGSIYAVGTLGSLLGCYLAPLFLLQSLGTQQTLLVCAALTLLMGVGGLMQFGSTRGAPAHPEGAGASTARVPRRWIVISLLLGFAVTIVEFAAVRFMGPWFGQSNHVWAHVIGVLMLALALGSWIGGRNADRKGALGSLWVALNAAAFGLYLVGSFGPPLFDWLAPDSLTSSHVLPAARWGSLVATTLLLGPPLLLLGMATPYLIKKAGEEAPVGRSAGLILAWGTVGGLVGCLITPTLLIPWAGSRNTILLAGALVAGIAGWGIHRERRWGLDSGMVPAAGVLTLVLTMWFWAGKPLRMHEGQVIEIESKYQTVRVVEQIDRMLLPTPQPARQYPIGKVALRFLRHDEDAETFQSTYLQVPRDRVVETWDTTLGDYTRQPLAPLPAGDLLTGGQYFEHMAIGAHYVPRPKDRALRVLIIGYAGGTVHRVLRTTRPKGLALDVLGVEIDPDVVAVADEHLGHKALAAQYAPGRAAPGDRLRIVTGEDGRTVVNALPDATQFDLILVDAYARTNYIPFQLASREFFQSLTAHLAPHGWIGVNVLGDGTKSPVAKSVAMTMSKAVGATYIAPNPAYPGNVILWTRPGATRAPRVRTNGLVHMLMRRAAYSTERLVVRYDPDAETDSRVVVLTDDRSPSDRLADEELGV